MWSCLTLLFVVMRAVNVQKVMHSPVAWYNRGHMHVSTPSADILFVHANCLNVVGMQPCTSSVRIEVRPV